MSGGNKTWRHKEMFLGAALTVEEGLMIPIVEGRISFSPVWSHVLGTGSVSVVGVLLLRGGTGHVWLLRKERLDWEKLITKRLEWREHAHTLGRWRLG